MKATHYRNPFGQWSTEELIRQEEVTGWELATLPELPDIDATPTRRESATGFLLSELEDIRSELARRKRWEHSPHAPAWPGALPDLKPFWQSIKDRVTVRDLYERHKLGILRKSGATWRGACPICETTGLYRRPFGKRDDAFSIFANDAAWHCFRCGEGGDVLTLARFVFNDRDFHRAALAVADEFGIDRPRPATDGRRPASRRIVATSSGRRIA